MNKGYLYLMLCCLTQVGLVALGWYIRLRIEKDGPRGLLPDFKRISANVTRIREAASNLRHQRP